MFGKTIQNVAGAKTKELGKQYALCPHNDDYSILIETLSCQPSSLFRTNTTQMRFDAWFYHKPQLGFEMSQRLTSRHIGQVLSVFCCVLLLSHM